MSVADESVERSARVQNADLCIVGAGITGLNALFVASQYLSSDQKIILVDRRSRVGGMWVDTYPHVRLHQPHGLFTAGNIEWTLGRDPSYLATKGEVLDHFEHCLDEIRQRVQVDELFGWEMESHEEADGIVRITCTSPEGRVQVIEANRLIKAYGFRITPNDPLEISSARVVSVSPDTCDVRGHDMRASDAPVWIAGGGKTAMDTAHALITEYPGREVNLVAGSGTFFSTRERFFPSGVRRWWVPTMISGMGLGTAQRFDGTNEKDVANWLRTTHSTSLTPEADNFFLGILSQEENTTIAAGLNDVIMDYFVDAVDRDGATELVFRSGSRKAIQPGSWIMNCTGYVTTGEHPYEPYVSDSGRVLSIHLRSATLHLTSYMGYFMTHLLFSDTLRDIEMYELDMQDLWRKSKAALPYTMFSLAMYNGGLIGASVPGKTFRECGLDYDRWYPMPRRIAGMARYMLTSRRDRVHVRRTLDTVRERFDVRCGPLSHE